MKKRREERGRPDLGYRYQYKMHGNIKDHYEDEVADWVDEQEVSNRHTFTVPYSIKFNAKKIEKLCYTRDLRKPAPRDVPITYVSQSMACPPFEGFVEPLGES
jgi:hypothetical protein